MSGVEIAEVVWRVHLRSSPVCAYTAFASDEGRASFWADGSSEEDGVMTLSFRGQLSLSCRILERREGRRFAFRYFDATTVVVEFDGDGDGGTELTLRESGFLTRDHREANNAGWVSVLMNLKAVVDHGVDLRNREMGRTWAEGYCEC